MKKRKLAESIAKDINEHDAHQVSKRLCIPTEGTDDPAVINLVVEDTEEKELVEYRFKVTPPDGGGEGEGHERLSTPDSRCPTIRG